MSPSLCTDEELTDIYRRQVDTVYRVCYSYMKNPTDTEDLVQETFLKLLASGKRFNDQDHERAWLIVTASNACKDALKHWWRKRESIDAYQAADAPFEIDGLLSAILALPEKYKDAVYLHYCEGYSTPEIARLLHWPQSTIRNRLSRARKMLEKSV